MAVEFRFDDFGLCDHLWDRTIALAAIIDADDALHIE